MERKAGILFSFQVTHSFFQTGIAKGLKFQPTGDAVASLSSLQGIFQNISGGFRAVCPVTEPRPGLIQPEMPLPADFRFSVELLVDALDFYNYTLIPPVPAGSCLYASNAKAKNGILTWEVLPLRQAQFRMDISALIQEKPEARREILVESPQKELVTQKQVIDHPQLPFVNMDFSGEKDGAYQVTIKVGQKQIKEKIYLCKNGPRPASLGFFEWIPQQKPKEKPYSGRLVSSPQKPILMEERYVWPFEAEQTIWQYLLVNGNENPLNSPQINYYVRGKKEITFAQSSDREVLPDGRTALVFTATQKLPFREIPAGEVFLQARGLPKDYQLPFASYRTLATPDPVTGKKSRIYIYL
ncbi:MAG: hypothetical protein H6581_15785 [Bacteroidia bacterium]|nr:hypothetical protein [Bacteroidia bacterium]